VIQTCDLVPRWDRVRQRLLAGRSLIVHAPRFFGRRSFATSMLKRGGEARVLLLNADDFAAGSSLDYRRLWEAARRQLGVPGIRYRGTGSAACVLALTEAVRKSPERLLAFLMGGGRGHEAPQFDLVTVFHDVLGELPAAEKDRLTVCVLDDFSLLYYEDWRTQRVSRWDYFSERLSLGPIGADTLRERLASLGGDEPWKAAAVAGAGEIHRLTGGHPGLVHEVLRDLREDTPGDFWAAQAPALLRTSSILESLHRALAEDSERLGAVARAYAEPQPVTDDFARPELQILRQLGILTWIGPATVVLCEGVIRELVAERAAVPAAAPAVVPSFPPIPSAVELDGDSPGEDDLVVLHLSDIHLGDHYPFRKPGSSGLEDRALRSAGELLSHDLDRLKLAGRIDSLIVSGDFTSRGKIGEFRRARDVIQDLLQATGLDQERLLVIAGNHDLDWAPEGQDHKVAETGVSRDNYAMFREILDKPGDPPAELLAIPSRAGGTVLRLLALDSNYVEGEKAGGIGFIDPEAFDFARRLLREDAPLHPGQELATWIVVHHHVVPVNSVEVKNALQHKVSVMGNAAHLLEFAAEIRAEVILHGHEHQPLVTVSRRWSIDSSIPDFHPVVILGAGSFSSPYTDLGPFRRNHYFLLYRRAGDLIVRSRELGGSGLAFAKHRDLRIPR
jgi:predicted phosphodiesterase